MKKYIICFIAITLFGFAVISDAFAGAENKCTVIQGVISRISKLPSSVAADYPDALYAAVMDVEGYISGSPVPKQISIVIPAFTKRKRTPEALYYVGAKIEAQLINWDDAPQKIQQTQIFDDINNFTLQNYYVPSSKKISSFAPNIIQKFSSMEVLPEEEMPPTVRSKKSIDARNAVIARDLAAVRKQVQAHGGYEKWNEELAPILNYFRKKENQNQEKFVNGQQYRLWPYIFKIFNFRKAQSNKMVRCLPGAIALKDFLNTKGVDLIIVNLPYAFELYLDMFYHGKVPEDFVFDTYRVQANEQLLNAGIEVIDIYSQIVNKRETNYFFKHIRDDWHQTAAANELLAKELKQRLARYDIKPISPEILGLKRFVNVKDPFESTYFRIERELGTVDMQQFSDPKSPVVVTGDSFSYNPTIRSCLSAFLVAEAGILPHNVARIGNSGQRKLADLCKLPERFWINKKVVVLLVAPQSFQQGWLKKDFQAIRAFNK